MSKRTPLYERHLAAGARFMAFGGWDMPLHYGSQIAEHHAVRRHAGVFDVSHMTVIDVAGPAATAYLRRLLANDVDRLVPGQALYSCMLNEQGGVIDDLIVYRSAVAAPVTYRIVANAATRDRDLEWLRRATPESGLVLQVQERPVLLAVQGPAACDLAAPLLPADLAAAACGLRPFHAVEMHGIFIGRTGYTGEDGWEIVLDAARGERLFTALLEAGATPCGLGARDTLRLEAGMNLSGQDMDESHSPLVSGLGWTVAFEPADRAFIGREPLVRERAAGPAQDFSGLLLEGAGVMRHGQRVVTATGEGTVTSGGFSPTMNRSIALARVPAGASGTCAVDIRGTLRPARIVRPPFVRRGRVLVTG